MRKERQEELPSLARLLGRASSSGIECLIHTRPPTWTTRGVLLAEGIPLQYKTSRHPGDLKVS